MPQGGGIGSKADYGERGRERAIEEGESPEVGVESKWDKGEGGGKDCK